MTRRVQATRKRVACFVERRKCEPALRLPLPARASTSARRSWSAPARRRFHSFPSSAWGRACGSSASRVRRKASSFQWSQPEAELPGGRLGLRQLCCWTDVGRLAERSAQQSCWGKAAAGLPHSKDGPAEAPLPDFGGRLPASSGANRKRSFRSCVPMRSMGTSDFLPIGVGQ